jgi:hypothetical protein
MLDVDDFTLPELELELEPELVVEFEVVALIPSTSPRTYGWLAPVWITITFLEHGYGKVSVSQCAKHSMCDPVQKTPT